jgi:hypothetical protein
MAVRRTEAKLNPLQKYGVLYTCDICNEEYTNPRKLSGFEMVAPNGYIYFMMCCKETGKKPDCYLKLRHWYYEWRVVGDCLPKPINIEVTFNWPSEYKKHNDGFMASLKKQFGI